MNELDKRLQRAYERRKQQNKPDTAAIKQLIRQKHRATQHDTSQLIQNFKWAVAAFAFICFSVFIIQPFAPNQTLMSVALTHNDIKEVHSLEAGQYRKQINEALNLAETAYAQSTRKPLSVNEEVTVLVQLTILENNDWVLEDCINHSRLLIKASLLKQLDKPTGFDAQPNNTLLALQKNSRGEITRIFTPNSDTLLVCP